jgi:hypothetical protein
VVDDSGHPPEERPQGDDDRAGEDVMPDEEDDPLDPRAAEQVDGGRGGPCRVGGPDTGQRDDFNPCPAASALVTSSTGVVKQTTRAVPLSNRPSARQKSRLKALMPPNDGPQPVAATRTVMSLPPGGAGLADAAFAIESISPLSRRGRHFLPHAPRSGSRTATSLRSLTVPFSTGAPQAAILPRFPAPGTAVACVPVRPFRSCLGRIYSLGRVNSARRQVMATEMTFDEFLAGLKKHLQGSGQADPKFLLITCIDLRYPGLIHSKLEFFDSPDGKKPGYFHKRYDQVSLAGAGLAAVITFPPHPKPEWSATFVQQVAISKKLHSIVAVVVLEHRTCGAYREFGVLTGSSSYEDETRAHDAQVRRMEALLKQHGLDMPVYSFLLPEEPEHDRLW